MVNFVTRRVDRGGLVLPSGAHADSLRLGPLQRELQRLRIPGMTAEMGKDDLLDVYEQHIVSVAEEIRTPPRPGELRVKDISQTAARRAALLIERAAQANPPATPTRA